MVVKNYFFVDMGFDIHLEVNHETNCLHIVVLNGNLNLCKTFFDMYNFDEHLINNLKFKDLEFDYIETFKYVTSNFH